MGLLRGNNVLPPNTQSFLLDIPSLISSISYTEEDCTSKPGLV